MDRVSVAKRASKSIRFRHYCFFFGVSRDPGGKCAACCSLPVIRSGCGAGAGFQSWRIYSSARELPERELPLATHGHRAGSCLERPGQAAESRPGCVRLGTGPPGGRTIGPASLSEASPHTSRRRRMKRG